MFNTKVKSNTNSPWPFPVAKMTTGPIHLVHLDSEPPVSYVHIQNGLMGYSYTFAYRKILEGNGKFVDVAVAVCSPKDQFSRKVGRDIARARLHRGVFMSLPLAADGDRFVTAQLWGMFGGQ